VGPVDPVPAPLGAAAILCSEPSPTPTVAHERRSGGDLQALLSLDDCGARESSGRGCRDRPKVCRSWLRYRPRDAWSWEAIQAGRLADEPLDWRPDPAELAERRPLAQVGRPSRSARWPAGGRAAFYLSGLTYAETLPSLD